MEIPYLDKLDKRHLVYKSQSLYLNHCTVPEFKKVFGDFSYTSFADENIAQFAIDNDLGEMFIIFDNTSGVLIHISLELYEEISLLDFLATHGYEGYAHFEFLRETHIAFDQHLAVRLNSKTGLIANLIFPNSHYVQKAETEFYEAIKKALENMEAESTKTPKVISLTLQ